MIMMEKLMPNKSQYYPILQRLNQYKINNPEDHIDAMNIINETLNIGIDEINEAIKCCQDHYVNYNYVDIFCEAEKKFSATHFSDSYLQALIEKIEFFLSDSEKKFKKIKQINDVKKIQYLILELHKNQFFLETYLRALRDYI